MSARNAERARQVSDIDTRKCFECDRAAVEDHHVVPVSRGGTRTVPLCLDCHGKVHELERSDRHACLTRRGLEVRANKGLWTGGRTRIGFKVKDNRVVRCAYEQKMIKKILDLHQLGTTLREIQAELVIERIWPRRRGVWIAPELRNRGTWSLGAVHNVVKRSASSSDSSESTA